MVGDLRTSPADHQSAAVHMLHLHVDGSAAAHWEDEEEKEKREGWRDMYRTGRRREEGKERMKNGRIEEENEGWSKQGREIMKEAMKGVKERRKGSQMKKVGKT